MESSRGAWPFSRLRTMVSSSPRAVSKFMESMGFASAIFAQCFIVVCFQSRSVMQDGRRIQC